MKDVVHAPLECRPNGVILNARQRLVGQTYDPEVGKAICDLINSDHVGAKTAMGAPETRVPKGFYLVLVAWLEAKEANLGGIREREKALLSSAKEWVGGKA